MEGQSEEGWFMTILGACTVSAATYGAIWMLSWAMYGLSRLFGL